MARLIAAFDWSKTSLGPIDSWAPYVQAAVSMMLQSPVPIILLWGPEGYTIYNDAYSEFAAGRHPRLLGQTVIDAWPEVAEFNRNVLSQVLAGKTLSYKDQTLTLFRNNRPEEVSMDLNYSPILGGDGHPTGVMAIVVETTGRVQSEESLKESERRFRTLADNIQNLAWMASPDGHIYWYNSRWYEYTGTTYEQMMGGAWRLVEDPAELEDTIRHWRRAIKTGEPFELLANLRAADGTYRHFLTRVAPVRDKHGAIQQWLGTNTDVEDLRQRHALEQRMERLSAQHDALLRLNRTKDEFVALASHQLRTPASAVKQYIGVLLGGFMDPPLTDEQRQYVQTAYDSNERELHIINELLKTAQIDAETYQIDMRPQDITPIVRGCVAALQPTLNVRSQKLTLHAPKKPVAAKVDATEIGLVFTNLLENASKYSHPGSAITVTVKATKLFAVVAVADTGVGIRKADQRRIFDKFTRIDNKLSDAVSGTGLGLYWVRQIVALHKGNIALESAPGKGSKFTVRLPL